RAHVDRRADQRAVLLLTGAVRVAVDDREATLTTGEVATAAVVVEAPHLVVTQVVLDGPALGGLGAVEGLGHAVDREAVARRVARQRVDGDVDVGCGVTG